MRFLRRLRGRWLVRRGYLLQLRGEYLVAKGEFLAEANINGVES